MKKSGWGVGLSLALALGATAAAWAAEEKAPVGYTDTPMLPDGQWRVHDLNRPHPPVVTPGTFSTTEQAGLPPSDAIVLFDGKDLSKWKGFEQIKDAKGKVIETKVVDARWKIENGYAEVNKTGSIETKDGFGSCQLHVEWASPAEVKGDSQGRGNSGIFLMGRYEIQVLDCYNNVTYADGQAASLYGQTPPLVNACRKPGEWQVYDIVFIAPKFDGEKLVSPAYVTIFHNGLLAQNHVALLGATQHKRVATYTAHPDKLPIQLQDHGNPVRYRSIWLRPL